MPVSNQAVLPGNAGQFRLVDLEMPGLPRGKDVLVRMIYAPVNPADLLVIDGQYAFDVGTGVPVGAEGVGIIEAVGDDVTSLSPGDMVLPLSRGNWCRYRLLDSSDMFKVPASSDPVQAAMLRINPLTARLLIERTEAAPGDVIVQNAATSSIARWVRAIAHEAGISVLDVVRRPVADLPDAVLAGDDLTRRLREKAGSRRICAALDCVAGEESGALVAALGQGGRLIVFGHLSGHPLTVPSRLMTGGGLSILGFSLRPAEAIVGAAGRSKMLDELSALQASRNIHVPIREIIPLSCVEQAITLARTPGRGRVLLDLAR